uniref:Uncharacterized protein n=1 Tax=viral metagenome TaxID=1070528 RepID=A0A6M3LPS1_9ZZZZ
MTESMMEPICPVWTYNSVRHVQRNMDEMCDCPDADTLDGYGPKDGIQYWHPDRYDGTDIARWIDLGRAVESRVSVEAIYQTIFDRLVKTGMGGVTAASHAEIAAAAVVAWIKGEA